MAILLFLNLQTNNDDKNREKNRKPALGGVGTIFQKGYSKEQEFDVVLRMDGKLVNTRVYGKGSLKESREACEKNNASLPSGMCLPPRPLKKLRILVFLFDYLVG